MMGLFHNPSYPITVHISKLSGTFIGGWEEEGRKVLGRRRKEKIKKRNTKNKGS